MRPISSQGGHSADVRMHLLLQGMTIPVVQLGPDFLLLDTTASQPPGEASHVLRVDESERRWPVRLPEGISSASKRVALAVAG